MPTVTDTLVTQDGTADKLARVTIDLVGASPDVGFVASTSKSIVGRIQPTLDATGTWSVTLVSNALITPSGTVYKVTVKPSGGASVTYYIDVPNGAGPYWVGDILTEAPATEAAYGTGMTLVSTLTELTNALAAVDGTAGGTIFVRAGSTISTSSALTVPNHTTIRGAGYSSRIVYTGTGTLVDLTNQTGVRFENLRISQSGASGTLFNVANSFRCYWVGCTVDGQYVAGSSNYRSQIGWNFNSNAGDCHIEACDINNLGEAVITATQMNYIERSTVGTCWRGVHGGDPTGVAFAAGMTITDTTFHGATGSDSGVEHHIYVDGSAQSFWVTSCWFEKCDVAIELGVAAGGPAGFFLDRCKIASHTSNIIITSAKQPSLRDIVFSQDTGYTPTDLSIGSASVDGVASNLLSSTGFEIATSTFPSGWTYIPRSNSEATQLSGRHIRVGVGLVAGQISYFESGNARVRIGYDGSKTVVTDAGGGRDVALISGGTPRQVLTAGADGVAYIGAKTQGTSNAGGAVIALVIAEATTVPTSNPTNAGVLYVESGALKYRGPSGTVTTIANA